jgi:hypothetical protein
MYIYIFWGFYVMWFVEVAIVSCILTIVLVCTYVFLVLYSWCVLLA